MEQDPPVIGHRRQFFYGVDDAVGVTGGRTDDQGGPLADRCFGGGGVGAAVSSDRHLHVFDVEVLGRFGEGWMGRRGRDDHRFSDSSHRPSVVACHLHSHEDALGPPRGERTGVWCGAEKPGGHGDHVELHLKDARVFERVQRVVVQVAHSHLFDQVFMNVVAHVVDEAEGAPATPVDVLAVTPIYLGQQFRRVTAVFWNSSRLGHGPATYPPRLDGVGRR